MSEAVLAPLRRRLIASCQPVTGGPMDRPDIVAAMAQAALAGGACGLRIEGLANLAAVRQTTDAPIVGLIKRDLADSPVRITPRRADAEALVEAGADIVAVDATDRSRPEPLRQIVEAIHAGGALALADCAHARDGEAALALGFDALASTLSGYTDDRPAPAAPDLSLVRQLAAISDTVFAEGRYHRPEQAADAIGAGAFAVVVGSAMTRIEHIAGWFASALDRASLSSLAEPRSLAEPTSLAERPSLTAPRSLMGNS